MKKKNKRKEPEFKKPFIVLTRRKIAGWFLLIFFLCAWMFVLGILVGRGTAPVKFDIAALENKVEAEKKDVQVKPEKKPGHREKVIVKDKTKLDFYEALKENTEDTKIPGVKKPKAPEGKVEKPAQKTVTQKPVQGKTASSKTGPKKSKPAKTPQKPKPIKQKEKAAAVAKTNAAGPIYTIQAVSVKDPQGADRWVARLKKSGFPAYRVIGKVPGKGIWFRVRVGQYRSKSEALGVLNKLKKHGVKPILVMK